jgi:spermidine synthase
MEDALGRHVLVEFYDCSPELLNDLEHIQSNMVAAAKAAGATVITQSFHHFDPYGISGVVVLQESHFAIHTWPEYGFASVDLFTCGGDVNPWAGNEHLAKALQAAHHSAVEVRRGQLSYLKKRDFKPSPPTK